MTTCSQQTSIDLRKQACTLAPNFGRHLASRNQHLSHGDVVADTKSSRQFLSRPSDGRRLAYHHRVQDAGERFVAFPRYGMFGQTDLTFCQPVNTWSYRSNATAPDLSKDHSSDSPLLSPRACEMLRPLYDFSTPTIQERYKKQHFHARGVLVIQIRPRIARLTYTKYSLSLCTACLRALRHVLS